MNVINTQWLIFNPKQLYILIIIMFCFHLISLFSVITLITRGQWLVYNWLIMFWFNIDLNYIIIWYFWIWNKIDFALKFNRSFLIFLNLFKYIWIFLNFVFFVNSISALVNMRFFCCSFTSRIAWWPSSYIFRIIFEILHLFFWIDKKPFKIRNFWILWQISIFEKWILLPSMIYTTVSF